MTQSGTAGKALADIVQNGGADGNMGSINQSGTGLNQRSFITQTGALAQDNDATSIQSGAGSHFNDITQSAGSLNTAMVTQSGALDHTNTTAQTGSGNNNTVTQN